MRLCWQHAAARIRKLAFFFYPCLFWCYYSVFNGMHSCLLSGVLLFAWAQWRRMHGNAELIYKWLTQMFPRGNLSLRCSHWLHTFNTNVKAQLPYNLLKSFSSITPFITKEHQQRSMICMCTDCQFVLQKTNKVILIGQLPTPSCRSKYCNRNMTIYDQCNVWLLSLSSLRVNESHVKQVNLR